MPATLLHPQLLAQPSLGQLLPPSTLQPLSACPHSPPECTPPGVPGPVPLTGPHHPPQPVPLQGKRCLVSGAGNVAQFCAELLLQKGATVLSLSDSQGYIYERDGLTRAQLDQMQVAEGQREGVRWPGWEAGMQAGGQAGKVQAGRSRWPTSGQGQGLLQ